MIIIVFVHLFLKNYSQVFLEEFKYIIKEKKLHRFINDNLEISSNGNTSDKEDSD